MERKIFYGSDLIIYRCSVCDRQLDIPVYYGDYRVFPLYLHYCSRKGLQRIEHFIPQYGYGSWTATINRDHICENCAKLNYDSNDRYYKDMEDRFYRTFERCGEKVKEVPGTSNPNSVGN